MEPVPPTREQIRAAFDRIADRYDSHAALEQEIGRRLLERTAFTRAEPETILDLGSGTGAEAAELKKQFRKARVVVMDFSQIMLRHALARSRFLKPLKAVCADLSALPLRAQTVDLVFSSFAVHWLDDPLPLFKEVGRVLKPGGMFLFSCLGQNSMQELLDAWAETEGPHDPPRLPDVLLLGDALAAAGFEEPVMDVERITLRYSTLMAMKEDLEATGNALLLPPWRDEAGLNQRLQAAFENYGADGAYPLRFEILFGGAFGPPAGSARRADQDTVSISVDSLLKSRPMGYD
jgi:malonyl-CoA O-methyltransferase